MPDASDLARLKMDTKTTLKASDIRIQSSDVNTASKTAGATDIMERFQRAAAQTAQSMPASGLAVAAVDVDFDSLQVNFGDQGPEAGPLRDARRLIAERKFSPALPVLAQVLAACPRHQEGTYLKAYCEHQLGRSQQALKSLRDLDEAAVSNRLRTKMRVLREEIRSKMLPRASKTFAGVTKARQLGEALGVLKEYVECDPGMGQYHYFVAAALIVGKKWTEAQLALQEGLRLADCGREELEQL